VHGTTRFVTCVPPEWGGAGNPSPATAMGVASAMDAALDVVGDGTLAGKTIAVQGAGNVASYLMERLLEADVARIVATDISSERCDEARARLGSRVEVRHVSAADDTILAEPCDVLAPCALGGILNPETIPRIRARIVCGAANNQLLDEPRDSAALMARGITYVPDYVANRMGIVSCANEQYGSLPDDPAIARHYGREWDWEWSIFAVTHRVIDRARKEGVTTSEAANALADEACTAPHPIWGHRGRQLVDSLVRDRWAG
jgi:glutamate dehydrogenase/leucine dehydrogenase